MTQTMTRPRRAFFAFVGFAPIAYIIAFVMGVFAMATTGTLDQHPGLFWGMLAGNLSVGLLCLGQLVAFGWHAASNRVLSDGGKAIWLILLLKLGVFAAPVYWLRYMRGSRRALA